MGALRLKVGRDMKLVEDGWRPLWVVDFPMFEFDARGEPLGRAAPPVHRAVDRRCGRTDRQSGRLALSRGYDCVLNGNEIGGGSIRIHRPDMQSRGVPPARHRGRRGQGLKFGFLLEALRLTAARRTAASPSASTASPP
jgi:aspartyl-tRNA synthetase